MPVPLPTIVPKGEERHRAPVWIEEEAAWESKVEFVGRLWQGGPSGWLVQSLGEGSTEAIAADASGLKYRKVKQKRRRLTIGGESALAAEANGEAFKRQPRKLTIGGESALAAEANGEAFKLRPRELTIGGQSALAAEANGEAFKRQLPRLTPGGARAVAAAAAGFQFHYARPASEAAIAARHSRNELARLVREAARLNYVGDERSAEEQQTKVMAIATPATKWFLDHHHQSEVETAGLPEALRLQHPARRGYSYQQVGRTRRMLLVLGPHGWTPPLLSSSELCSQFGRNNCRLRAIRDPEPKGGGTPSRLTVGKHGVVAQLVRAALIRFYSGAGTEQETDRYGPIVNRAEGVIQHAVADKYGLRNNTNAVCGFAYGGCGLAAPGHTPKYMEPNNAGGYFIHAKAFEPDNGSGHRLFFIDARAIGDTDQAHNMLSDAFGSALDLGTSSLLELLPKAAKAYASMVPKCMEQLWTAGIPSTVFLVCTTDDGGQKGYVSIVNGTEVQRFWASTGPRGLRSWKALASDYSPFGRDKGAAAAWQEHGRVVRSKLRARKKSGAYGEAEQTADFIAHFARDNATAAATAAVMKVAPA